MAKKTYDESSIQVLEGLEAVRKRPGMYIGSTDSKGLHHLVWEIVDNAIDEALTGYGNEITVTMKEDNSIVVEDAGRGMPYKLHKTGVPTTQVIFTTLHAGGKFSDESGYKISGGLHGVGSSVVNALSEFLEVTIYRDGLIHKQLFQDGGNKINPLKKVGESKKTGTTVWFKPNPKIFSQTVFSYELIRDHLQESAFLIKGIKINLINEKTGKKDSFQYEKGILEYVNFLTKGKKTVFEPFSIEKDFYLPSKKAINVDISLGYIVDSYNEVIRSYVNNVRTSDGGTHEVGFKTGFTKALNDYARKYNLIKDKDPNLDGSDIREGIICVISLKIPEEALEFEGQTKGKLGTTEAKAATENIVYEAMTTHLEESKEFANFLVTKAVAAGKAREAGRKAREEARQGKKANKKEVNLSGKLSPAQGKDKSINELFLVEGDSAGGSAKNGRNRAFQAILPLRGKVLNTEKTSSESVFKNEELSTIIYTIGAGYGANFDIKKANYKKVIIMTDADTDGSHIQILLITFFFRYMRELVESGSLYIALPPLYKLEKKKGSKTESIYAWTDEELKALLKGVSSNHTNIQRYKGLGEMNASQLWDTTMNPAERTLIQVKIDDAISADKRITLLMGDNVSPRREWIDENVDFEITDSFDIENGGI